MNKLIIIFLFLGHLSFSQSVFQSVGQMVEAESDLYPGQIVQTEGYYSAGDGGGAKYLISENAATGVDIAFSGKTAELLTDNGSVSFRQCGARGDGSDDMPALQCLFSAVNTKHITKVIAGGGSFRFSKCVLLRYDTSLTVDLSGSTILYPSDDMTVNGDANTLNTANFARSAFFVRDCHRVKFVGGKYIGSQTPNINNNIGSGVYLYNSSFCEVSGFESVGGNSIVSQSQQVNDIGTIVRDGVCKSPAQALTVGDMSLVENISFEQPTTGAASPGYFSHPFYVFAPHKYITLRKCTFKGGDRASIQVSGSNAPTGRVLIEDCTFINPKGIFYGGDDGGSKRNYHYNVTIKDCKAFGQYLSIVAYGIRGLTLKDNWFEFSRSYQGSSIVLAERLGVTNSSSVNRDAPGTLIIEGNTWALADTARFTFTGAGSVLDIYDTGNRWDSIGTPCLTRITNNRFVGTSYGAITVRECANFEISGNYIGNHKGGISLEKCAFGRIDRNLFCADTLPGILQDMVDMDNCSWMELGDNRQITATKTRKSEAGAGYSIEGAINPKLVFNVSSGWVFPTHCKQQIVFFYGGSWCDGDSVKVCVGSLTKTFKFKASSPGASEFNSMASLMSAINSSVSTVNCRDYGDSLGVVTRAILIERKDAGVDGTMWAQVFSQHLNAGAGLSNDGKIYGKGGCACGSGDKVVVWSPSANYQGATVLIGSQFSEIQSEGIVGACSVFKVDYGAKKIQYIK